MERCRELNLQRLPKRAATKSSHLKLALFHLLAAMAGQAGKNSRRAAQEAEGALDEDKGGCSLASPPTPSSPAIEVGQKRRSW
jgi:hypothetical protein